MFSIVTFAEGVKKRERGTEKIEVKTFKRQNNNRTVKLEAKEPFMMCFNEPWGIKFHSVLTSQKQLRNFSSKKPSSLPVCRTFFQFNTFYFIALEGKLTLNAFFSVAGDCSIFMLSVGIKKARFETGSAVSGRRESSLSNFLCKHFFGGFPKQLKNDLKKWKTIEEFTSIRVRDSTLHSSKSVNDQN